jgi:hypothetical protein
LWSKNSRIVADLEAIMSLTKSPLSDSQNPTGDSMSRVGTASTPEELQRIESNEETDQTE